MLVLNKINYTSKKYSIVDTINNVRPTNKQSNKYSIYVIIKRFTGGKRTATEATKLASESLSHSPKPLPLAPTNIVKNTEVSVLPKTNTQAYSRPSSPEKTFTKENNFPSFNFTKKEIIASADKVPTGLAPGKYTPFGFIENNSVSQKNFEIENTFIQDPNPLFVPIPPPLPSKTIEYHPFPSRIINLEKDLQKVFLNRTERYETIMSQLNELEKRGLYDHETGKAKSSFYLYRDKGSTNTQKELINLSEKDFLNNPLMNLGLLKVINMEKTEILSGNQAHPILLYTLKDDKIIVWAYLTSENDVQHKKLSDYQPFSNKPIAQYLKIITPMIVKATDIEPLPEDQQTKGLLYIKNYNIQETIKNEFTKKLLPKLKEPLLVYDGSGITSEDIDSAINNFEQDQMKKAKVLHNKYKQILNQCDKPVVKAWLLDAEKNHKHVYPYLKVLIEQNENK